MNNKIVEYLKEKMKPPKRQAFRRPKISPRLRPVTANQILAALKEMARGKVKVSEVARALTEGTNFLDFSPGKKVYIAHGPGAGYRGTLKEVNNGWAKVSGNMGVFWFVPVVFLQHDHNPPEGNTAPA